MAHAFDQTWYRVATLRPRLRLHAEVHRHRVRGTVSYVLQDHQTGRHFRISAAAHALLCMMDGRRTMGAIVERLSERMGADRPSHAEAVRLLVQLHQSDLLAGKLPPDMSELDRRAGRQDRSRLWSALRNPLAIRVPLWDPDRFLTATTPFVRALCGRVTACLAAILVLSGGIVAAMHGPELVANVSDRVFAADNVLLIALLYPLAKAVHEAGHAYAVKLGGGAVHEVGLMLLVFVPMPYVDASASAGMPEPWRRIMVSAAGMMAELVLAALASIAWALLSPGPLRAAMLDVMVLSGISTLVFNANPLLRFDGYYVLGDLIGVPNLDTRAKKQLLHVIRRWLLGMRDSTGAIEQRGEGKWLVGYGVLSQAYRIVMVVGIGLLIATKLFALGVALAIGSMLQMLVLPVLRGGRWLLNTSELHGRRPRAMLGAGLVVAALGAGLFVVPVPHALVARGVVWVPNEAIVRASADGFVAEIAVADGQEVVPGTRLLRLQDPVAAAQLDVYRAEVAVQEARFNALNLIDRVQARLAAEQLARATAAYDRAVERSSDLVLEAARPGRFVLPNAATLAGRYVHKGQVLGYVLGGGDVGIRVVVPQAELELVRSQTTRVDVILAERPGRSIPAQIVGQTPSALDRAPAPALSPEGGGPVLADPTSPDHDRPLDRWYAFQLALPAAEKDDAQRIGAHAAVRFDFGAEPIALRLLRGGRQLLLRTLNV